jgi:membrane protein implicated in regulation of membrane protease activity
MKKKLWIALVLFVLLSISSLVFGGYVAVRNYQLDTDNGTTKLTGLVEDSAGDPLSDVSLRSGDSQASTDENGIFLLEGVDVGIVIIDIYKPGYVPVELTWLAYPESDIDGDLDNSPNNISTERELVLLREIEDRYPSDNPSNGTNELLIDPMTWHGLVGTEIIYGNGSEGGSRHTITNGSNNLDLAGDGTVKISVLGYNRTSIWKQVPGKSLNITWMVLSALGMEDIQYPDRTEFKFTFEDFDEVASFEIEIVDPLGERYIIERSASDWMKNGSIEVYPGRISVILTGSEVRDLNYMDVLVPEDGTGSLSIEISEAGTDKILEGMDLGWNYLLAGTYLVFSLVFVLGVYLVMKGKRWTLPFAIALLGFLVRGLFIGPLNLNIVFATVIVIILFTSRDEFAKRESKKSKSI